MSDLPPVRGFRFAGVAAGIKKKPGALDLGAIVADAPASCAGLFTRNVVKAAPVLIAQARARRGVARAVLVNAGCANACTGEPGLAAAKASTAHFARALGVPVAGVLPASTGVIGALLPVDKVSAALPALLADLDPAHAAHFADAICTTDRWRKVSAASGRVGRNSVTTVGIAKGAGMIHPDMATTLLFVVTDARVAPTVLRRALGAAARETINAASVDGDTSTNDTLLALASGAAGDARVSSPAEVKSLTRMLTEVLEPLARSIVADGEGAEHLVTLEVSGASTDAAARAIAQSVATSPLVKTAIYGKDPNWGRILAAAGRAGVRFDPSRAQISVGPVAIVRAGIAVGVEAERDAHTVMLEKEYSIQLVVGRGRGRARYTTCDLGHAYIDVNASYRS